MTPVLQIALGEDQKNGSMKPTRAPISHNAISATRNPIWKATMDQVGHSRRVGRRRRARLGPSARRSRAPNRLSGPGDGKAVDLLVMEDLAMMTFVQAATGAAGASMCSRSRQYFFMATKRGELTMERSRGRGRSIGNCSITRPGRLAMT